MLDGPFEKIQLTDRGFHKTIRVIGDGNTFPAAKRVKPALCVSFQFQFIVIIYLEAMNGRLARRSNDIINRIVFLGEIGNEPVDDA
jgi:hypothetical protein